MFHVAGPHQSERLATHARLAVVTPRYIVFHGWTSRSHVDGAMLGNDIAVVVPLGIR